MGTSLFTYRPDHHVPRAFQNALDSAGTGNPGHIHISLSVARYLPWHRLYLEPDPHGQGSFRPTSE